MFKDEVKLPFFRPCIKEAVGLTCLVLGFTFDHSLVLRNVNLCVLSLFTTQLYMPNAIYDLVLFLQSEGLNNA